MSEKFLIPKFPELSKFKGTIFGKLASTSNWQILI